MCFTVPFNNMRTPKFKPWLTNVFSLPSMKMFSSSFQLPTTAECAVIKSLCTVQTTKQWMAVVGSWEELRNIWLTVMKNTFIDWALNFRVRMSLKGTVKHTCLRSCSIWSICFILCSSSQTLFGMASLITVTGLGGSTFKWTFVMSSALSRVRTNWCNL